MWNDDDDGASCHTVTARGFHVEGQVADQSGLADAVRAINNLATGQGKKDTPSPTDVKGLRHPKEFIGEAEDFQRWSKKTEVGPRGAQAGFRAAADAYSIHGLSRVMSQMTLSPTRGRKRWRHGEDCRNVLIRREAEGNETCCVRSVLL